RLNLHDALPISGTAPSITFVALPSAALARDPALSKSEAIDSAASLALCRGSWKSSSTPARASSDLSAPSWKSSSILSAASLAESSARLKSPSTSTGRSRIPARMLFSSRDTSPANLDTSAVISTLAEPTSTLTSVRAPEMSPHPVTGWHLAYDGRMDVSRAQLSNLGDEVVLDDPSWPWTVRVRISWASTRPALVALNVEAREDQPITSTVMSQLPLRQVTHVAA